MYSRAHLFLLAVALVAMVALAGCSSQPAQAEAGDVEVSPYPSSRAVNVVVYVPEPGGRWLEREDLVVNAEGESTEELVLQAWLSSLKERGFLLPRLKATAEIRGNVSYVCFSQEIRQVDLEHEGLVVKSLVNTLTAMEGIEKVQILVEGKKTDTLAGNSFVGEALATDDTVIARDDYRPIAPSDPRVGEMFIEGRVTEVLTGERALRIEQFLSPDSPEVGPLVSLAVECIIHFQEPDLSEREIALSDISVGDIVGIILTAEGNARAVIVSQ